MSLSAEPIIYGLVFIAVLVLVDGNAQRFTSAHIRKVRAEPPLTSASPCSASPILQLSPAAQLPTLLTQRLPASHPPTHVS